MRFLFLALLCVSGYAFAASSNEQKRLPLSKESLVYFQKSLNDEYVPAIEKGHFSKEHGLSSVFYKMQQVTAQKIDQDPKAQKIAVQLWDIVDKDPAYKLLLSAFQALNLSNDNQGSSNERMKELVNMITVQARKDIQLGLNQRGCYIRYPMQDLNKLLGLQSDVPAIMRLYAENKGFSAQKQKKLVWASALAQCYSTQIIMLILAEKKALSHLSVILAGLGKSQVASSK